MMSITRIAETRREFVGKFPFVGSLPAVMADAADKRGGLGTPLPCPRFYWGVGIENCWIAQTNPLKDGNRRLLDVFLQMQHYSKWKEDLNLAAELGINTIRYSVPWYRAEPRPGVYDWSWIDKPVDYLVNKLKIVPVMDLIHYGTPTWMEDGVGDERFPEAIGQYAHAMARHFRGLVDHYSPHNEPQVTTASCGIGNRWPPYGKSARLWARIGVQVAKGMVLETQAIREALPTSRIISVETFGPVFRHANQIVPPGHSIEEPELRVLASAYPASLAYGMIPPESALGKCLVGHGVSAAELEWFGMRAQKPDILGWNCYPAIPRDAKQKTELREAAQKAVAQVEDGLQYARRYFDFPLYLTETSSGIEVEQRVAYVYALAEMIGRLRKENFPLVGVNWWPLYGTIQWAYRDEVDKPLTAFLYPGGWNNGLYNIEPERNGDLRRVRTAAVDAYAELVRRDRSW